MSRVIVPGRATKAARQPAASAPATSHAWAATRWTSPMSVLSPISPPPDVIGGDLTEVADKILA